MRQDSHLVTVEFRPVDDQPAAALPADARTVSPRHPRPGKTYILHPGGTVIEHPERLSLA